MEEGIDIDNNEAEPVPQSPEKGINYPPVVLKDVKPIALAMRLHIQNYKWKNLSPLITEKSVSLKDFSALLQEKFKIEEFEAFMVSRYIYEKDSALLNGKIKFEETKTINKKKLVKQLEDFLRKEIKFEVSK